MMENSAESLWARSVSAYSVSKNIQYTQSFIAKSAHSRILPNEASPASNTMFSKGEENLSPDQWNFWRAREKELLKEIAKLEAVVSELKDELQE